MKIIEAIRTADTEHVVCFLLTAYIETLHYYDPLRSCIPETVKRMPLAGIPDVAGRVPVLRNALEQHRNSRERPVMSEALEVFSAAFERLDRRKKSRWRATHSPSTSGNA